eukprot:gene12236-18902_t
MSFSDARRAVRTQPITDHHVSIQMHRMPRPMSYEELLALDENNVKRGVKPDEWKKNIAVRRATRTDARDGDPITQDEIAVGETVAVPVCGHVFKVDGLKKWFEKNHLCPVCRHDVLEPMRPKERPPSRATVLSDRVKGES